MHTRYAVGLEYDGTQYAGWQRQPFFASTIQEQVERALGQVAAHTVETTCAGRTDAGVHATAQIIHFDADAVRSDFAWLAGGNRYLPADIRLQWIQAVPADFHARYSARERHYRYLIRHHAQPSALWARRCHWHKKALDAAAMHTAATRWRTRLQRLPRRRMPGKKPVALHPLHRRARTRRLARGGHQRQRLPAPHGA